MRTQVVMSGQQHVEATHLTRSNQPHLKTSQRHTRLSTTKRSGCPAAPIRPGQTRNHTTLTPALPLPARRPEHAEVGWAEGSPLIRSSLELDAPDVAAVHVDHHEPGYQRAVRHRAERRASVRGECRGLVKRHVPEAGGPP